MLHKLPWELLGRATRRGIGGAFISYMHAYTQEGYSINPYRAGRRYACKPLFTEHISVGWVWGVFLRGEAPDHEVIVWSYRRGQHGGSGIILDKNLESNLISMIEQLLFRMNWDWRAQCAADLREAAHCVIHILFIGVQFGCISYVSEIEFFREKTRFRDSLYR